MRPLSKHQWAMLGRFLLRNRVPSELVELQPRAMPTLRSLVRRGLVAPIRPRALVHAITDAGRALYDGAPR